MADLAPDHNILAKTPAPVLEQPLNRRTEHNIHVYSVQSGQDITYHIGELRNEWSLERSVEAAAAGIAMLGLILGAFASPVFLIFPIIIVGFALAHSIWRYRPDFAKLPKQGLRTQREIDAEIFAMRFMRGELSYLPTASDRALIAERAIAATRAYTAHE